MTQVYSINLDPVRKVCAYALNHMIKLDEFMAIYEKKAKLIGDRLEHCVYINPPGYKFVFSLEEVPTTDFKKIYLIKKLSGSLNIPNKYPSMEFMKAIMEIFEMKPLEQCSVKMNEDDPIPNIEIHDIISVIDKS